MNSPSRWHGAQRPNTVPSSVFGAANSVVVPLRDIVVGVGRALAGLERQSRLRAIERLDRFFSSTDSTIVWRGGAM